MVEVGVKNRVNSSHDYRQLLRTIDMKSKDLKKLMTALNVALCNCAYSNKEMETQIKGLEKLNVPAWEREIILDAWTLRQKLGNELLQDIKNLTIQYGVAESGNKDKN